MATRKMHLKNETTALSRVKSKKGDEFHQDQNIAQKKTIQGRPAIGVGLLFFFFLFCPSHLLSTPSLSCYLLMVVTQIWGHILIAD